MTRWLGALGRLIFVLGVLASALDVEAQAVARPYRIGWLHPSSLPPEWVEGFRQGLRDFGYVEGRDVIIEYRWGDGRFDRLPAMAADLVGRNVNVIIAGNSTALRTLQQATRTIPIVMMGANDPVGTGLVTSLARPGGNITGLSGFGPPLSGKRLELLKEVVPGLTRITALYNSRNPSLMPILEETHAAANTLGLAVHGADVRDPGDLDRVFSEIIKERSGALVLPPETLLHGQAVRIAQFALKHRLPSISAWRQFADAGGLMSYGVSIADVFRRAVGYIDKIRKGARPADLPVEEPTKFELILNLKTAKALGLAIPESVRFRADQLIQ